MGLLDIFFKKDQTRSPLFSYSGGDGTTEANAVVINAGTSMIGIPAEYAWLRNRFGERGKDWESQMHAHGSRDNGKVIEFHEIGLADGTMQKIYFEISSFYGK
jgi:hypothetical protein